MSCIYTSVSIVMHRMSVKPADTFTLVFQTTILEGGTRFQLRQALLRTRNTCTQQTLAHASNISLEHPSEGDNFSQLLK